MFVGGEFYYDGRWFLEKPAVSTDGMYFLNGGTACLTVISDYLKAHRIKQILLPSYLCPSIVNTLERCGIDVSFYTIRPDFSIDLEDVGRKVGSYPTIYFINYFGFLHPPTVREFLQDLRHKGILVVEDNAQAGFSGHTTGDFILNSIRKLAPYDGGYLITPYDLSPYLDRYRNLPNRRLPLIRAYREQLARYLLDGVGDPNRLDELFSQAENHYETNLMVLGDSLEREKIEHLDWDGIRRIRRENYEYLLSLISEITEVSPIFPVLQTDNLPLGLPVYLNGVDRDLVNEELGKNGIGLTIHWDEIRFDPRTRIHREAVDMASRILTLTIDQRTSHKQMDYLALHLMQAIKTVKTRG
jgi:dTDP-4-amino-4,6-dideoxygalactose transaminase